MEVVVKDEEIIDLSLSGVGWMKRGTKKSFGGINCCKIFEMGKGV